MGFMDKIKSFVSAEDEMDDDEYDVEDEPKTQVRTAPVAPVKNTAPASAYENKGVAADAGLSDKTKMVLFEPRSFGEAETAGSRLKEGRAVVVNLHKLDPHYSQRTIDFLSGVVFARNGAVKKIGENVILCYPEEVGVAGTINYGKADSDSEDDKLEDTLA